MNFDEVKRSFDRDCRIGVEPLLVSATVEIFDNRRHPGCEMTTSPPTEVPAGQAHTAWDWGASVSLPQQVHAPPANFIERIGNTIAVREQALRFCAVADVSAEMKQEIAKFLACVQTPPPILDCAGEKFPALRNFVFVVLKPGVERQEGDWNPQVVVDEISEWNAYCLRFTQAPSGNSISLVELVLPAVTPAPPPFPVTIEMANLLPSCGVLTVGGATSLNLRAMLPHNATLWDSAAGTTVAVAKLEREGFFKRSVISAFSHHRDAEREPRPNEPPSPVRSFASFDTLIDGRALGLDDLVLHDREPRPLIDQRREPQYSRDFDRDERGRDRERHGTELVMNATQVAESAALAQARGSFDRDKYRLFLEEGASTSQSIITAMAAHAEVFLVRHHPTLARSWTTSRCKSWMLAEFRPAQTSSSSAHVKLAWFHPDNNINSLESLFVATALWTHLETELRGKHMRIILQALQALTILDARKAHRLGWRSMLYLLEARAMRLRHKVHPDSPAERARLAFSIRADDEDVKSCLDNPVTGPPPPPRATATRYEPYQSAGRGRDRERERERERDSRQRNNPPQSGYMVPSRFRTLEGVCFEWCKADMPAVDANNPCPGITGNRTRCDWDHAIPGGTASTLLNEFQDWCKARTPRPKPATGAQRRSRRRGAGAGDD